jgi:hydrogenase/urease accessory protein HupE
MRPLLVVPFLLASSAFAHPGAHHENMLASLMHLLTEPDHLAMAGIAIVLSLSARRSLQRRAQSQRSRDDDSR